MIGKRTRRLGNKRTSGDDRNYSIVEIGLNTEKNSGDLRRLVATKTPVKKIIRCDILSRCIIIIIIIIRKKYYNYIL